MISFHISILVYATAPLSEGRCERVISSPVQCEQAGLFYFSNPCGVRECGDPQSGNTNRGHPKGDRCLACRAPPVQADDDEALAAAFEGVRAHRLLFWDALLVGFGATRQCAVPAN